MKPRTQPLQQARFGILQIDVGNADALEPEFHTPAANCDGKFDRVNWVTVLLR